MGCWGYEVFEDDYALDLKGEFDDLLEEGLTPLQATKKMIEKNEYMLDERDDDDYPIFYIVMASLQIQYSCLQNNVKEEALNIIDNDIGMDGWIEEGQDKYENRKSVLMKLRNKLI